MKINCLNCKKEIDVAKSEINRGNGKFCSRLCCGEYQSKNRKSLPPNTKCAYCTKPFRRPESRLSKSGLHFCCRKHKDLAQRIGGIEAIQPSHYGLGSGIHDYRESAFQLFSIKCNECGYDKYPQVLQVHHKDGNRRNNPTDGSNWEILCPTHHKEKDLILLGRISQLEL